MQLHEVYENRALKEFGEALGKAIGHERDYASLTDFESAQTKVDFADVLHRFLRRFHTMAAKKENLWYCPSDSMVQELIALVDQVARDIAGDDRVKEREAVRLVRAALVSRALPQATYIRIQSLRQVQSPRAQQARTVKSKRR